jgi:hypothetical protein
MIAPLDGWCESHASSIDVFTMTDFKNEKPNPLILNLADQAMVSNSISP